MKKQLIGLFLVLILVFVLAVPALAEEETEDFYVIDLYGLFTEEEHDALTAAAEQISQTYDCSVHIGVIGNLEDYGFSDIESCAESFFDSFGLGVGEEHNGILLLLSIAERDYDIDAHGEFGHYAFTDYGKTTISDVFLDNFREDDWYGGCSDYLDRCAVMLGLARDGEPVDVGASKGLTAGGFLVTAALSLLVAWLVCSSAADATAYIPDGAVQFRVRNDQFINRTVSRRKIERSSSSHSGGGTTISSGGHSHSSGKF